MEDYINETAVMEQDLLMTVDDFAKQEGVTARTVYRWIELGRLDTVERLGKKYVNASVPLKSAISDSDNVRDDMKSKNVGALQSVNIFEEYMKSLRDNGRRYQKTAYRWQVSFFMSVLLLVVSLIAGTALSLILYYRTEALNDKLVSAESQIVASVESSDEDLARSEADKAMAHTQISELNQQLKDMSVRLDKEMARSDDLRGRLDSTLKDNAILLQRFSELATIDEVASVESMDKDTKKKSPKM